MKHKTKDLLLSIVTKHNKLKKWSTFCHYVRNDNESSNRVGFNVTAEPIKRHQREDEENIKKETSIHKHI